MNATLIQSVIWLTAGGCLFVFMRRRRTKRSHR
jgi:hypothetical protein